MSQNNLSAGTQTGIAKKATGKLHSFERVIKFNSNTTDESYACVYVNSLSHGELWTVTDPGIDIVCVNESINQSQARDFFCGRLPVQNISNFKQKNLMKITKFKVGIATKKIVDIFNFTIRVQICLKIDCDFLPGLSA